LSVISLDHNFVLIRVPKTGSQSQAELYMKHGKQIKGTDTSINNPPHITSVELKDVFIKNGWDWDNCFKFGFVRNPWEREVSCYFYLRKHKKYKDMSFSEYLKGQAGQPSMGSQMHTYLTDVDYVARYEKYEEETNSIWKKLNLPGSPKLENHNATEHKPYWEYYNDDEVLLVQKAYQKDIELYNYEFEE